MKTTLKKVLQEFALERHLSMRGTEYGTEYYELSGGWITEKENHIDLEIASHKNLKITLELTQDDFSIPEEKVYGVLRFFSNLNMAKTFTKFAIDFRENNTIKCHMVLLTGDVGDSIPAKYSQKIKEWIDLFINIGFELVDEIQPYIQRIINDDEDPDELWVEFVTKD